ncbi:MAG: radical SAM family heme chaperone HemW [Deltaproteobacteria bacterium]|nr:radical SAM family heme chaperone HemW [Deltaproteobacteria bacterium]
MRIHGKEIRDNSLGIYVHIPFCQKKCLYCDFNSFAQLNISDSGYIDAVLKELAALVQESPVLFNKKLETIYIGGGTPSLIEPYTIKRLVSSINQTCPASNPQEITIEINPGTVQRDSLSAFRDAGVNRLSIGIQSFNDTMLKILGRMHSPQDSVLCYEYARKAGFDNIGIDLIFGLPDQSLKDWEQDLKKTVFLKPEHISTYNLTIEQGTPFFNLQKDNRLALPPEEEQVFMYEHAITNLKEAGYNHYEISNFSLNGFESRHNLRYWQCMDYIGLGAGAHSYVASLDRNRQGKAPDWGMRWWNENNPNLYMEQITGIATAVAGKEILTTKEAIEEGIFLGLRRITGIDTDWFSKRFGWSLKDLHAHKITQLKIKGMLYADHDTLRLTHQGLLLSNEVFAELI